MENFSKFIKRNGHLLTLLGLVIAFLTWLGFDDIYSQYINKSPAPSITQNQNEFEILYSKLSKLSTNTSISIFKKEFGDPDIIHSNKDEKRKEFIFINPHFYLQALTDLDENVLSYAVTSRKKEFQPSFKRPDDYNNQLKTITLNKTVFNDLNIDGDYYGPSCFYMVGARRIWYYESNYEANPGNYQTFLIGINDAGYINFEEWDDQPEVFEVKSEDPDGCEKIPSGFRESALINTYAVTAPHVYMPDSTGSAYLAIGVNLDEVRVIDK